MPKKVLLVDDDEITHILSTRLIIKTSFAQDVITLINGKEAIDYFKSLLNGDEQTDAVPDIIFLDINMPIMNGWDFLDDFMKFYFQHFPDVLIYILSSSIDPDDINKAKEYTPVKDYLVKPLTKEHLENL